MKIEKLQGKKVNEAGTCVDFGNGQYSSMTFTEVVLASSSRMINELRRHSALCGDLKFNFEPTDEVLDEYFRNYKYKKINRTRDGIMRKVKSMFECYDWKWITVETDYFITIAIPFPMNDYSIYRPFDIGLLSKEKTAAIILFMIVQMIQNAEGMVDSCYHIDLIKINISNLIFSMRMSINLSTKRWDMIWLDSLKY